MNIDKMSVLEKLMNGVSRNGANSENRAEKIRSRAKMCDGTQKFGRMAFLLKRILGNGFTANGDFRRLYLKRLFVFGCQFEDAFYLEGRTDA